MDVYTLKTSSPDVVVAHLVFATGTYRTPLKQTVAHLLDELLPGGSRARSRSHVLEALDGLGATVEATVGGAYLELTVHCTRSVFQDVLALVFEQLCTPKWSVAEFGKASARVRSILLNAAEDTSSRARNKVYQELYKPGHPLYSFGSTHLAHEIEGVTRAEVASFLRDTLTGVGALAVVAGDIPSTTVLSALERCASSLPSTPGKRPIAVLPGRTRTITTPDHIVSLRDKMNVDMFLGMPLSLTRESEDLLPLTLATHILGGGATSRLFHVLRNQKSLTYGAYAGLQGFADPYPGMFVARALFPNNVFKEGRTALREQVALFVEKGVTARELRATIEQLQGKYAVGLSTTAGIAALLLTALKRGKTPEYLRAYPDLLEGVTLSTVNRAIREHCTYALAVTAGAGSVDVTGKPLL